MMLYASIMAWNLRAFSGTCTDKGGKRSTGGYRVSLAEIRLRKALEAIGILLDREHK